MSKIRIANPENITFMNLPYCAQPDTLQADFAIMGIPFGASYDKAVIPNDQALAPTAIRRESAWMDSRLDHWDFDLDGPLLDGKDVRIVDCGDTPGDPTDTQNHYQLAEETVRTILARGAYPIILGGDHGVTIPAVRAFDRQGPINIVQIDAHIDWRDNREGVRDGYSSPIRRASELPHVNRIFQVGMRAQGSARTREVKDALAYGAEIVTAYDVHQHGMDHVLDRIPKGERYYLSIDADGLDPSVMPAVAGPAPGGLLFHQVRQLIHGLTQRGRLMGMDIVEITPSLDVNDITAVSARQLILNYIGATVRADYFT
jgi:agmatinase